MSETTQLTAQIELRIGALDPEIELISLERTGTEALRLFIDHPNGVDLALCERVTNHLRDLLDSYALEVSSPGLDRPLTRPEHFRRFLGHMVRVQTTEEIDGRRSFTGTLADADERKVSIETSDGEFTIELSRIRRSNLVPELTGSTA